MGAFVHAAYDPTPASFRRRLTLLALMGLVFYSSYGVANYWASTRAVVPEIFWLWERHIPFWAWSIVPYWTLNVFYAAAFLCCRTRGQLTRLLQQLLLAQAIAVIFFIACPLMFSWEKPATSGFTGRLFTTLAGFDQPFNQAPSLHIMLTLIIGRFYWYRFARAARLLWLAWLCLIALSVLTTYQHHFIDVPTGVVAGAWVLWLLPLEGNRPISRTWWHLPKQSPPTSKPTFSRQHGMWLAIYASAALLCLGLAWGLQDAYWWLLWPALSLTGLAYAYARADAANWQKRPSGKHSLATMLLAAPLYLIVRLNMTYWLHGKRRSVLVHDRLALGSILASGAYQAVVDVCAEYPCWRRPAHYRVLPCLDMVPIDATVLVEAADAVHELWQQQSAPILVCCALGYGRSVAVVLTYLVRHQQQSIQDALNHLHAVRPQLVLSPAQLLEIQKAIHV